MDGDLVNDKTPVSRTRAGPGNLHVWGECNIDRQGVKC